MDQQRNRKQRSNPLGLYDDSFLYDQSGLEILALLQRHVNNNMGEKRFASDVIYHFKEHLMKAIAHNDIQQKLQFFWSRWHPLDEKESDWKKIYKLGLKGLPRMKEEKKDLVMAKAKSLVNAPSRPSLRSDSEPYRPHGSSPKKRPSNVNATPSSSRVQKSRSYSESPAQMKAKIRMSTPAHARRAPSSPSSGRALSTIIILPESSKQIKHELDSCNSSSQPEKLYPNVERSSYSQLISERDELRNQKTDIAMELDELKDKNSEIMTELNELGRQNAKIMSKLDKMKHKNAQLMVNLEDLRSEELENTRYWKKLHQKSEKERKFLERQNRYILADHGKGQDELRKKIMTLNAEKYYLEQSLNSYEAISKFKDFSIDEHWGVENMRNAAGHINTLLIKLHGLLSGHNTLFFLERVEDVKESNILMLFMRAFGLEKSVDSDVDAVVTTKLLQTKLRSVLLGLVSAAICTWVFEVEVGALFQEHYLAYSELQALLAAQDKQLTKNFEFATHKKCINNPFLRELVIPRRARCLARRILTTTTPLLKAHKALNNEYAAVAAEWLESHQRLTEIFKQALYAKIQLLLSTDMYKCALYPPGTPFNTVTMKNGIEQVSHTQPGSVVDTTVFPGLYRYATNIEEFSYNRFLAGEAAPPEGILPELLTRAVVETR